MRRRRKLLLDAFVAAVEVIDPRHPRLALGGQPGEDEADAGAQIRRHDGGALQRLDAGDGGRTAVNLDPGAHADEFGGVHEAVLEDALLEVADPLGKGEERHHLGLEIGGEAREGRGLHVHGANAAVGAADPEAGVAGGDVDAGRLELVGEGGHEFAPAPDELDLAAGDRRREHVGAKFDPVGDHRMGGAVEPLHAADLDGVGALAVDLGPHAPQAAREIDDLGLAGGILQERGAPGEGGGHEHVLGRADGNQRKLEDRSLEPGRRIGMDVAITELEPGAQRLEAVR